MKLPYLENAYVPEAKITRYLLDLRHPSGGKDKAVFFYRFGFTIEAWEMLAQALIVHAATHEVASISEKLDATNYAIEGVLNTPGWSSTACSQCMDTG